MWVPVSGFMVTGLVSWLSFTNHCDSESFLLVHALLSHDGCRWKVFWKVVGQKVSPFDLSQTLLVSDVLFVPCSLSGPPVVKITQADSYYGAWPGWVVSISVLPVTVFSLFELLRRLSGKGSTYQCRSCKKHKHRFDLWVRKIPWKRNGNPLQCSCLENPMGRGAW